jgi:hypothetical protein
MRIAVITPYCSEPRPYLTQCHESISSQTIGVAQYWVADGIANPEVVQWADRHLTVDRALRNGGCTPRALGALCAAAEGAEAIVFLDADNWFRADHIERMVNLQRRTGADVCVSGRSICRLDGSILIAEDRENDGDEHVDTSNFFLTRKAFGALPLWMAIPTVVGPLCDRIFWWFLKSRYSYAIDLESTVFFRSQYRFHYADHHEPIPAGAKNIDRYLAWWNRLAPANRSRLGEHFLAGIGFAPWLDEALLDALDFPTDLR